MDGVQLPQSWVNGLLAALFAACGVIMRLYKKQIDTTQKQVVALEHRVAEFVPREEVVALIAATETRMDVRHQENTANFRELRTRFDQLNDTLLRAATTGKS